MTLSDLASLGSFISGVAVLGSLIYLALQVRQNREHMAAQISQSRTYAGMQQQNLFVADPAVADLMLRGNRGDPSLSALDGFRYWFLLTNTFLMIEDEFRQYRTGLISQARHDGFVKRITAGFQLPGYRAMWVLQRDGFEPDFQAFMDPLMRRGREKDVLPDIGETWRALVAAELRA